jgi:lipoprotein-releasing system ATP-binding protein
MHTGISDVFSEAERRRNHLRRTVFGFVFQFYHLLPDLNVLENVLLPRMVKSTILQWSGARQAAHRDALDILKRVGLSARIGHKPNELSGGERQRAAIARALVHHPQILFADEPTGNLDAEAGANIMSILTQLHHEGQTIVMVTHDPGIAAYADRTLLLESGRLRPA